MKLILLSLLMAFAAPTIWAQEKTSYKEFYDDGTPKAIQHEGFFNGCQMPIGTDTIFYKSGAVLKTVFYDNRKSKLEEGCHEGWTIAIQNTFFKNGKIKSSSQTKFGYEGVPCNCGIWIWRNEAGNIVKNEKFADCYDQQPCNE